MNLVDEDDDVGVLLQLFQQGAYALFKLSAILCSCHHSSHVEVHQTLVEEHWRCAVACDELCKTLDDGAFTHARLADENGVVLLTAAQYLDDALNLTLTPHHRVEFPLEGSLCQVCREVVEHWRLAIAFLRGGGSFTLSALVSCGVHIARLVILVEFFIWQLKSVLRGARCCSHIGDGVFVVHVVEFQYFFSPIAHLVVQDGQQQVLHIHRLCVLDARFEHRQLQDVAGFLVEHEVAGVNGLVDFVFPYSAFQFCLYRLQVDIHACEEVHDGFVLTAQNAKQQMFRPHRPAGQACGFFATESENL